jgi:hypothetical protein
MVISIISFPVMPSQVKPEVHAETKQSEWVCCYGGETSPSDSNFQVVFTAHFLTGAIRCQSTNASLHFVLVKFIMHNSVIAGRKYVLHISVKVSCCFWVWR